MDFIVTCQLAAKELRLTEIPILKNSYYPCCAYDRQNECIYLDEYDCYSDYESFFTFVTATYGIDAREFSIALWTILHEFGHYYDIMDYDTSEDLVLRNLICADPNVNIYAYYNLPSELAATEWAIDFIKTNYLLCKRVDEVYFRKGE
jgi:hypothetical protein